jgi:prevent-host-death family protein
VEHIGIRELRNQTASAVRRAGSGERIIITVDGRPVAQLGPLESLDGEVTLADLAARGLVTLPNRPDRPDPPIAAQPWAGINLYRALQEVRGK